MTPSRTNGIAALFAAGVVALCTTQAAAQTIAAAAPANSPSEQAAIAKARSDSARYPYTKADIDFMTGMIAHHSQAIVMSRWAPTHGASSSVQLLASRIINAQQDEIATMQRWLRDRQQPVPDGQYHGGMSMKMDSSSSDMKMDASDHTLMPGMLTDAQMKQLDAAHGADFDRFFLTFMIQHHRGALAMVKQLFDTYGAGQDELVFKFATDANVDQTTEIARMQRMLVAQMFGTGSQ